MTMRTRIKICGITRIDDGIAAACAGADAIGVVLWRGTPRQVDVDRAREIAMAMPPFVKVVGLFVDPTADEVAAALERIPLDALQFHAARYDDAAGLLFDAFADGDLPGGTGTSFDWTRLSGDVRRRVGRPIVLSGGLDPDNVEQAIRAVKPWGVDVSSGVEARDADGRTRRGVKDAVRIAAFMQGVRNADGGSTG